MTMNQLLRLKKPLYIAGDSVMNGIDEREYLKDKFKCESWTL